MMRFRHCEPELMDDPALDRQAHFGALRGLQRLNRWTGAADAAWGPLYRLARTSRLTRLHVLDIATGGADIPIGLWQRARRANLELILEGCDISPTALDFARKNCDRVGAPVRLFEFDAVRDAIEKKYDVVICSTFLHHLGDSQVEAVLGRMIRAATKRVVVVDLLRSRKNWLQVWIASHLLTRSRIVHTDGPRSIRAAFTISEFEQVARKAGMTHYQIEKRWPCRFVFIGDPTRGG